MIKIYHIFLVVFLLIIHRISKSTQFTYHINAFDLSDLYVLLVIYILDIRTKWMTSEFLRTQGLHLIKSITYEVIWHLFLDRGAQGKRKGCRMKSDFPRYSPLLSYPFASTGAENSSYLLELKGGAKIFNSSSDDKLIVSLSIKHDAKIVKWPIKFVEIEGT